MSQHPFLPLACGLLLTVGLLPAAAGNGAEPAASKEAAKAEVDGKTAAQWIKLLGHEDQEERDLAVEMLLEFEEPPIAELIAAYPESQFATKLLDETIQESDLLDGLGDVFDELDVDALPGLIKLLDHKEDRTRGAAASFLGLLALPGEAEWKTVGPLKEALGDKRPYVREMAAWARGRIGGTDAEEAKADLEKLVKQDADTMVRVASAMALANIANSLREEGAKPQPIDPLVLKALSDKDDYIRSCTARYVMELREQGTEALPEIEKLFKDKSEFVRLDAAVGHHLISGKPAAMPIFKELLNAQAAIVREQAAYYLGEMEDKSVVAALRKLAEEDPSRRVRSAARTSAALLQGDKRGDKPGEKPVVAPET